MPAESQWMLDIPRIIEELELISTPVIDRAICKRLFGVGRRQAIYLMGRLGGCRSGNTILID